MVQVLKTSVLFRQEAFRAFHNREEFVRRYMKTLHIGRIRRDDTSRDSVIKRDFEALRQTAKNMVSHPVRLRREQTHHRRRVATGSSKPLDSERSFPENLELCLAMKILC